MTIFVGIIRQNFRSLCRRAGGGDLALMKKGGEKKGLAQAHQAVTAPLPAVQEDHNGKGYYPDNDEWIFY